MIELSDVRRVYPGPKGNVAALDGVSLAVAEGEFVAIRGRSGSGKSTLLLTMGGMVRPSSGQVVFRGTDMYTVSAGDRARYRARDVGFVFQMFHLIPYLSVIDNVLAPGRLTGQAPERARAEELLERFGMGHRLGHTPAKLSTGERQRVAVARALLHRPALVLADEPTGNLDTQRSREIMDLLCVLNRDKGITILMVTHEPDMAGYADRVIRFVDGLVESDVRNGGEGSCS